MRHGSRGDTFVPATWEEAFHRIREVFSTVPGNQMTAIAGQLADAESMVALKDLFHRLGSDNLLFENERAAPAYGVDVRYGSAPPPRAGGAGVHAGPADWGPHFGLSCSGARACSGNYILNSGLQGLEEADYVLLVGTNPRHEAPLLQARLRKAYLHRGQDIAVVGPKVKLTVEYDHYGSSPQDLVDLLAKRSSPLATRLAQAKRPAVIVGADVALREDAPAIFAALAALPSWTNLQKDGWNGYGVLQRVRRRGPPRQSKEEGMPC